MKLKYSILFQILVFLTVYSINAQTSVAITKELSSPNNLVDSNKVKFLITSINNTINKDTLSAGNYSRTLQNEITKFKKSIIKGEALRTIGVYYFSKSNYETALDYLHKSVLLFDSLKTTNSEIEKANSFVQIGLLYHRNGDFNTALEYYLNAENIVIDKNKNTLLLKIYINLSDIQLKLNRFDKAVEYMKKGVELTDLIDDPSVKADYFNSYGNMYIYENEHKKAKEFFDTAREIGLKDSLYKHLSKTEYNYAYLLSREEKYLEAQKYYAKSLEWARKSGDKYDICDAMYKVAFMSYYMEDFNKANKLLLEALEYAENIKSKILKRNILDVLLYLEAQRGNYKLAYDYLQMYVDVIYEIFSEDDQKQTNFLNAKYEAAKKEHEISQLLNEKQIQLLELERRNNLLYLFGIIIIAIVTVLFFVRQNYRNRKRIIENDLLIREQKVKELEKEKQIVAIQAALTGEENERFRIARDLHDGLGGILSGTKMALESYKNKSTVVSERLEQLNKTLTLIDTSISELRRIARNLMPQTLMNNGLKEAISEYCSSVENSEHLKISFRFYGTDIRLKQSFELSFYRIAQELINNVIKHSKGSEANIQLVQDENRISLTVQDNGIGFNKNEMGSFNGHGLNNIKTRVESLNGHLEIETAVSKGTEINIVFENIN
ncbi:MAG: sensor histidine kinase [Melioribacteraceae bacterium]|nr:sensor histidine kinase [Melioribacteraceae bacterium]